MQPAKKDETQAVVIEEIPAAETTTPVRKKRTIWIVIVAIIVLILTAVLSSLAGYKAGIEWRTQEENTYLESTIAQQYDLALTEMQSKQFYRARQRFEFIIGLNPEYKDVKQKLAEALVLMSITATPTQAPTSTPTAIPDDSSRMDLFMQAESYLEAEDWTSVIETLLNLRKMDPEYRAVEIDGLLYMSYRNRGREKILLESDLESGIYDLTKAQEIAPLDTESNGFLIWTRYYINGASNWDIDWGQAVFYFSQVANALPNLRDGSGMTSVERYRISLVKYAEVLRSIKEWCEAKENYEIALTLGPDTEVEEALSFVTERCELELQTLTPQATPSPTLEITVTPGIEITPTPTPTP